jgi:hypothetical protein
MLYEVMIHGFIMGYGDLGIFGDFVNVLDTVSDFIYGV